MQKLLFRFFVLLLALLLVFAPEIFSAAGASYNKKLLAQSASNSACLSPPVGVQ